MSQRRRRPPPSLSPHQGVRARSRGKPGGAAITSSQGFQDPALTLNFVIFHGVGKQPQKIADETSTWLVGAAQVQVGTVTELSPDQTTAIVAASQRAGDDTGGRENSVDVHMNDENLLERDADDGTRRLDGHFDALNRELSTAIEQYGSSTNPTVFLCSKLGRKVDYCAGLAFPMSFSNGAYPYDAIISRHPQRHDILTRVQPRS